MRIDLVSVDVERVTTRPSHDRLRRGECPELLAEVRDLDLQRIGGVAWLIVAPQHIRESAGAERLTGSQQQRGQQRAGKAAADLDQACPVLLR
jgi:hypothetical protein